MPSVLDFFKRHKASSSPAHPQADDGADGVTHGFASLTLNGKRSGTRQSTDQHVPPDEFVGGFSPAVTGERRAPPLPSKGESAALEHAMRIPARAPYGVQPPGPLPRPPEFSPMPVPEYPPAQLMSKTMQYAQAAPHVEQHLRSPAPDVHTRPHIDPTIPTRPGASPARRPPAPTAPQHVHGNHHARPSAPDMSTRIHSESRALGRKGASPSSPAGAAHIPPPITPHRPHVVAAPSSAPKPGPSRPHQPPPLQVPVQRQRAVSSPSSPTAVVATSSKDDTVQCSGTTKSDQRCRNRVKVPPALTLLDPDVDVELERFCRVHMKTMLEPTEVVLRTKNGDQHVKFADWIPDYLQPSTQANLRLVMEKPISKADKPGYIYTFEIRDSNNSEQIQLKVGRAVKLNKRIDEWSKQCGSKEQILRGFWPGGVEPDDGSLMKGRVRAGPKGPWCHRLERLVHLELADLSVNAPYIDPAFPNAKATTQDAPARGVLRRTSCPDCGRMHKEIFTFARIDHGRYNGKEWESLVKPVIEKWGAYVEAYLTREDPPADASDD